MLLPSDRRAPRHTLRRLGLVTGAALALLSALPAHALGRLTDVQVIDRDSGDVLTVYWHRGEHWVAGHPGARYAVALRNTQPGRVLGVVSVDGVNVISGETAALHQTGYVLGGWQSYQVTGWRKSDNQIAAFHFTAAPASYAARTGRPDQVGVIGVALFREKVAPPPPPALAVPTPAPWSRAPEFERQRGGGDAAAADEAEPASAFSKQQRNEAPESRAQADAGASASSARRMAPAAPAARLGTGHGEREVDRIAHTTFERRRARPDEIVRIRYDSRENLIAMGVIPAAAIPPRPNPFPDGSDARYAPDPS